MSLGEQIKKLKSEGLSHKAITEQLDCSKSTVSYHCSISGKQKTKERTKKWRKNIKDNPDYVSPMNNCALCKKETKNLKYCSKKCFQVCLSERKVNQKRIRMGHKKRIFTYKNPIKCNDCNIIFNESQKKYCPTCFSKNCQICWDNVTYKDLTHNRKYQKNSYIRNLARECYKKSNKSKQCYNCGYNKHYEVCHIKAINEFKDDDLIIEINHLDNLIALCPNCHWELDSGILKIEEIDHVGTAPTLSP